MLCHDKAGINDMSRLSECAPNCMLTCHPVYCRVREAGELCISDIPALPTAATMQSLLAHLDLRSMPTALAEYPPFFASGRLPVLSKEKALALACAQEELAEGTFAKLFVHQAADVF